MKLGQTVTVVKSNRKGVVGTTSTIIEIDNKCNLRLKYRLAPEHRDLWFKEDQIMSKTKISDLPISKAGTMIRIRTIWNAIVQIEIKNKIYNIWKPKSKTWSDIVEGAVYRVYKTGKNNDKLRFEKQTEKVAVKRRSIIEIKNDLNEDCDELLNEIERNLNAHT